jgi:eukaryotic-like serine/threonine-protein kinase
MDPARWTHIQEIYRSALPYSAEERESFLAAECAGDEELRHEISALLRASELESGAELGPYRIEGALAEGGMGRIYRAIDTRLQRPVAVKISTEPFSRRFEYEWLAISALNHPNICTLYDVGSLPSGAGYMVTELVEGETLREWLKRFPPLDRRVEVARQVLAAMRAAHDAGIIHRDLKPSNIMVRFDGYAKVLDFGLAKRMPSRSIDGAPEGKTDDLTVPGIVTGTVSYMSPEQIQGQEVDARSDLFVLGIILFEMLESRHPWPRKSVVDIMHAIVHDEPPLAGGPYDAVIGKLLAKEPAARYSSAAQALDALNACAAAEAEARAVPAQSPFLTGRRTLAGAALAVIAAIAMWRLWPRETRLRVIDLRRVTSDAGLTVDPALSRDGKMLAYASDRVGDALNIWVQQVAGGDPVQVTKGAVDNSEPAFSPDGSTLAFRSERDGGGVYVIPMAGGSPRRIAAEGRRPRFSPDGNWLAYWVGDKSVFSRNRIYVVPAEGGEPRRLAENFYSAFCPVWSPDGKRLLFAGADSEKNPIANRYEWWLAPLDGSVPVPTGLISDAERNGVYPLSSEPGEWADDSIFFAGTTGEYAGLAQNGAPKQLNIWRQPLKPGLWKAGGRPEKVTEGAAIEMLPAVTNGLLALATTTQNLEIWTLPLNRATGQARGPLERVIASSSSNQYPAVSRDGSRLFFVADRDKHFHLYAKELRTGAVSGLTKTDFDEVTPLPSADGQKVMYYVYRPEQKPAFTFWQIDAAGGTPRLVCGDCDGSLYYWSKDEKKVIYYPSQGGTPGPLMLRDLGSGRDSVFAKHSKYDVRLPRLSPDENWVALQTVVSQTERRLFVAPVRDWRAAPEDEWQYVRDARAPTAWSPSGGLLYFLSDRDGFRCIWAQRFDVTRGRLAGEAFAAAHLHTSRRTLSSNIEVASIGLSLTADRLYFSMPERTGNIWIAQLEGKK